MERGQSLEEAIEYGRSIGITETDPSADIDGWMPPSRWPPWLPS